MCYCHIQTSCFLLSSLSHYRAYTTHVCAASPLTWAIFNSPNKVDTQSIQRHLASGDVVLLTSLGYAASGEAYNVVSEALAAECAAALKYVCHTVS